MDSYRKRFWEEWRRSKIRWIRLVVRGLSPFTYLGIWRVGRMYESYLNDRVMAEKFKMGYLPMELQRGVGSVLDVGCGRGRHVAMLTQCGFDVVGVDLVEHDYWRRVPNAEFIKGDAVKLGFIKEGVFDLCISFLVLSVIEDDWQAIRQMSRVLKRDGWVVVQVTNRENLRTASTGKFLSNDRDTVRYYTVGEVRALLERSGFEVERVWTEKFYSPILTGWFNYLFEILLPRRVMEYVSDRTEPEHRGLINIVARKVEW